MEYLVKVYCPYCLKLTTVNIPVYAPPADSEWEKYGPVKKVVGRKVTCPHGHEFTVEEEYIMSIVPSPAKVPRPPYPVGDIEAKPPPKWSLGAFLKEDVMPPTDVRPVGSPYLKRIVKNDMASFIYEQKLKSKEYPEYVFHINYQRHIWRPFWERAINMKNTGHIREAIVYLGEHYPGFTVRNIADWLSLGYWFVHRVVVEKTLYTRSQAGHAVKLLAVAAERERWPKSYVDIYMSKRLTLKEKTEQIIKKLTSPEGKKFVLDGKWRGEWTYYPIHPKSEQELIDEARKIARETLVPPRPLTPEERLEQLRTIEVGIKKQMMEAERQRRIQQALKEQAALEVWKPTERELREMKLKEAREREKRRREKLGYYL